MGWLVQPPAQPTNVAGAEITTVKSGVIKVYCCDAWEHSVVFCVLHLCNVALCCVLCSGATALCILCRAAEEYCIVFDVEWLCLVLSHILFSCATLQGASCATLHCSTVVYPAMQRCSVLANTDYSKAVMHHFVTCMLCSCAMLSHHMSHAAVQYCTVYPTIC